MRFRGTDMAILDEECRHLSCRHSLFGELGFMTVFYVH